MPFNSSGFAALSLALDSIIVAAPLLMCRNL